MTKTQRLKELETQAMLKKHTWTSLYKAGISNGFGAVGLWALF